MNPELGQIGLQKIENLQNLKLFENGDIRTLRDIVFKFHKEHKPLIISAHFVRPQIAGASFEGITDGIDHPDFIVFDLE